MPDLYSAMAVVARSDMAALIPRRLGLISQRVGLLKLIELPHPGVAFEMSLLILKERLNEPAVAWMAKQLIEVGRLA